MRGGTDGLRMSSVLAHRGTQDQSDVQIKGGAQRTRAVKDIPRLSVMRPGK
jgi:hypothetical protein